MEREKKTEPASGVPGDPKLPVIRGADGLQSRSDLAGRQAPQPHESGMRVIR